MKKVLFVTNLFPRSDMPRCGVFNAYLVRAIVERGAGQPVLDVLVPVPEWRFWRHRRIRRWVPPPEISYMFSAVIKIHYVPVFYIPFFGRSFSWLFYRSAFLRRRDLFERCDAVLGSWLYPDCVAAAAVAEVCDKPFYARLHGTDRFHLDAAFRSAVCRRTLDMAENIFVNAQFMSEALQQRCVRKDKISVVRNGVDRDLFHCRDSAETDAQPASLCLGSESFSSENICTFLWVGNLVGIKAPAVALKAFAAMIATLSKQQDAGSGNAAEFRLAVVGDGSLRKSLELLAAELGVADYVVFCGSVPHREIALWMNAADCLLLTSCSEGMPNVVIEALASGTPVVSTDVGDVSCVVENGLNGYIIENGDTVVSDIADAMRMIASRTWNADEICASAAGFDWKKSADTVLRKISE
jgi:glycosyltransferase involved in cell wall biosynthesis